MDAEILKEIKEIRKSLAKIIGTSELPTREQFSKESLDNAADEFKKLSIKRGEWIRDRDISGIIKKAPYNTGKFIIENFGFTNYFVRHKSLYFNRKGIVELNKELRIRNINLAKYMELFRDKEKFNKHVEKANEGGKKKGTNFTLPEGLKDVNPTPYPAPAEEIKDHIKYLKAEFEKFKLSDYINLYYDETYAMFKHEYYWDRYLKPDLKKQCTKWCNDYNHANYALKKANESPTVI
jgi:hypothetical protein